MIIEEQRTFITDKMTELEDFVNGTNIEIEKVQFDRLYDLLSDSMCGVRMKPFTIQVTHNKVGVKWTLLDGYVSVLFGPGDAWEWEAHHVEHDLSACHDDGSDSSFETHHRHNGSYSYKIGDTPYYSLPTEIEKLVSIPDTFVGTYEPILKPSQYEVTWVTNKWDGMLSGYARCDNELYYFDMVEETYFKRNRMFALYKLSRWEQFIVWCQYHWWLIALAHKVCWKLYWWIRKTPTKYWAAAAHLRQTHEVVGYFEM